MTAARHPQAGLARVVDVEVYRNLNRRVWSVRDPRSRLVLGYAESIELRDVTCVVHETQRQRALREGRRNVHAHVRGTLVAVARPLDVRGWHRVGYNPFRAGYFVSAGFPRAAIVGAQRAYFDRTGAAWMFALEEELLAPPVPLAWRRPTLAELRAAAWPALNRYF